MPLIQNDLDFIFRLVGNRDLVYKVQQQLAEKRAQLDFVKLLDWPTG